MDAHPRTMGASITEGESDDAAYDAVCAAGVVLQVRR